MNQGKKPATNIVSIKQAVTDSGNNVRVVATDGSGIERTWNLSPGAQDGLLKALLVRPPVGSPSSASIPPVHLKAIDACLYSSPKPGAIGLEVQLLQQGAVHILLPDNLARGIVQLLGTYLSPGAGASSH